MPDTDIGLQIFVGFNLVLMALVLPWRISKALSEGRARVWNSIFVDLEVNARGFWLFLAILAAVSVASIVGLALFVGSFLWPSLGPLRNPLMTVVKLSSLAIALLVVVFWRFGRPAP